MFDLLDEDLENAKSAILSMREALLDDGTICGEEPITHAESKKWVLRFLDSFAGALAAAHFRMAILKSDRIFEQSEKDEMTKEIIKKLERDMDLLPEIKDCLYCLGRHFVEGYQTEGTKEELILKRQIVQETLNQLELLQGEIDVLLGEWFAVCDCS
jgi:hypothetical protein